MFTGIIETLGTIQEIKKEQNNTHITVESAITAEQTKVFRTMVSVLLLLQ
jgi:riboflavin synthase alpha subunit